mmetsp:Transcript_83558/g.161334  ORF Transcript_83558/g.161334 Transcript_83558/m.161334 type:complete len:289 (-) Transcript_83558:44-910(-)
MLSFIFLSTVRCNLQVFLLGCMAVSVGSQGLISLDEADQVAVSSFATSQLPASRAHLILNRFTFHGNVLHPKDDDRVTHWIVNFCPSWWEPCQHLASPFLDMAEEWESRLNTEMVNLKIRFATVDCAVDKVLCNEQGVDSYPTVHRYTTGKRSATWVGGQRDNKEKLAKWLTQKMNATNKNAKASKSTAAVKPSLETTLSDSGLDLLLVVLVLAVNFWVVVSNPQLWQKQPAAEARASQPAAVTSTTPRTPPATGNMEPGSESEEQNMVSVGRFLPKEWAVQHQGMEL